MSQDSNLSLVRAAQEELSRRKARRHVKEYSKYLQYQGHLPALHHEFLLDNIQEVFEGRRDRLMVFMPPGMAKSTYSSIIAPSYFVGKYPDSLVICASSSGDLTERFSGEVRNTVAYNSRYKALFPDVQLSKDTKAKGQWNLQNHHGGYYATTVGGQIVGRRANLIILDDIVKGREAADSPTQMNRLWEWLYADLFTRLLPDGKIILIMTRWSQNDPAGRLLPEDWNGESGDIECEDGKTWRVVCLQAEAREGDPLHRPPGNFLWTDFYDDEWWQATKKAQTLEGTRNWPSLYQQVPSPEEGIEFKREWFNWYDKAPEQYTPYICADFAVTKDRGDYTEIGVFGVDRNDDLYIAPDNGWWSGKETADVYIDKLLDLVDYFKPHQFVSEKGVIRNAIEPYLDKRMDERRTYVAKEWLSHIGDKTAKARAFQARAANGKVYLPRGEIGERILKQLLEFPAGRHDDVVDVCGFMGQYLQSTTRPNIQKKKSVIVDRWDRAFQRHDGISSDTWRTA